MSKTIVYENERGYISLEPTGQSMSYVVWLHGPTAAKKIGTYGLSVSDALKRAKDRLR